MASSISKGAAGPQVGVSGPAGQAGPSDAGSAAAGPWPAGVILAGGKSSRFGSNKALALYQGRPLIAHAATVMAEIFTEKLLVTNTPEAYAFLGWPMTGDLVANAGPLAGIQAALNKIQAERAFIVACDMPRLDAAVITRICRCPGDWDVVMPELPGGGEPLHAVYHRRILPAIDAALARGEGKISRLLAALRVRTMSAAELGLADDRPVPFANINFTRDLRDLP
jgi:molybdopterin-guanine dinucleotide biosynthesis protein A